MLSTMGFSLMAMGPVRAWSRPRRTPGRSSCWLQSHQRIPPRMATASPAPAYPRHPANGHRFDAPPPCWRISERLGHGGGDDEQLAETAYFSAHLWRRGIVQAGSTDPGEVNQAMMGLSYDAPEGIVTIDRATRHTWRSFNMGMIRDDGGIQIVWSAEHPIRPVPYPRSRAMKDWDNLLESFYLAWNHDWVNHSQPAVKPGQP